MWGAKMSKYTFICSRYFADLSIFSFGRLDIVVLTIVAK